MKNDRNYQQSLLAFVCALALFSTFAAANVTAAETDAIKVLKKLLKAVEACDYDNFVADGNARFKAGLTKQMLEGVCAQLSPRMKNGYDTTYLGQLKQQGCQVYLWKLVFKDAGDDTLARLVLKEGKVAGFWLQ